MNQYFADFVKTHGGDDVFSSKIGVTRQTIGNIKRGRNKATDKVINAIEAAFPDFEKALYYSTDGVQVYVDEINRLTEIVNEQNIRIKILEENHSNLIKTMMGKHKVYTSNLLADNLEPIKKTDEITRSLLLGVSFWNEVGEA